MNGEMDEVSGEVSCGCGSGPGCGCAPDVGATKPLEIDGSRYEAVPERLIVKAGLAAAASLVDG